MNTSVKPDQAQDFLFVRYNGRFKKIAFREISHIEADKNYCRIHTPGHRYVILSRLHQIEAALPEVLFLRVHRSFIVSLGKITAFTTRSVWLADLELPLSEVQYNLLCKRVLIIPMLPLRPNHKSACQPAPEAPDLSALPAAPFRGD